jgi:hypothetical protein
MPPSFRYRLLRCKHRLADLVPTAECFGVFLGVLGFDLLTEGRANLGKALLATGLFALIIALWRIWRHPHPCHRPPKRP